MSLAITAVFFMPNSVLSSETNLEGFVAKKAATLELVHRKAKKALVTAAQDKSFAAFFDSNSHDQKTVIKDKIDHISLAVQSRFHVEEMCLIVPTGAEVSRIVGNEIAYDLAEDEQTAIFFAPGFATPARRTHVSPVYMSPDAGKWVVAYVTPVRVEGHTEAILHYEHGLDFFQATLNRDVGSEDPILLAIDAEGLIVSDSRREVAVLRQGDAEDAKSYFERFELAEADLAELRAALGNKPSGSGEISGGGESYSVAYRTVENWTILAIEPR
jgi:hypothetical protein